ncbi:hypothetical protein B4144_0677 [Bacillus atrophaeus]|nr:hypothetical protein B4144_0677 [Bacillus atrophaeus]
MAFLNKYDFLTVFIAKQEHKSHQAVLDGFWITFCALTAFP